MKKVPKIRPRRVYLFDGPTAVKCKPNRELNLLLNDIEHSGIKEVYVDPLFYIQLLEENRINRRHPYLSVNITGRKGLSYYLSIKQYQIT